MPEIGSNIPKADINLIDETFDASHSESYHLSIQTEPGRLTFCVFNTVVNKYIVLRSYPLFITGIDKISDEWRIVIENDELSGLHYKSSGHLWISPRCTLVPGHVFDANETDTYLTFNHGEKAGEQTLQNYIRPANLYSVFSYPEALVSLLRHYQPNIRLFHQTTPLIESLVTGISSPDKVMAIYLYSCYLDVVIVRKNELLFYNTFRISAPEDVVYFLTGVSNLFDMDLSTIKLIYVGNTKQLPHELAVLMDYTGSIAEWESSQEATYSHYIQASVIKDFINLFNLYGCGL